MTLKSGTTIGGRYQIIQPLGRGGFGQTYLAEDRQQPGTPRCVVKQLKLRIDTASVLQDARQRFEREATALYQLGNHPQIPRLLAHFAENQEFYLVQEFIDGQDLEKELKQRRWSETETIALLQDVLEILEFVHQQRVIHRDIKPSNLIRRRQDGKMVLIDFGSVKEISSLSVNQQGQTILTKVVGTLVYMPLEQQNGKPVFSSDIYALGMTAIEACLGCPLIELETDPQTGETIWRDRLQVSPKLFAILEKMVRRNYRERYLGASEVLKDLEPLSGTGQFIGGRYKILSYLGGGIFGHTYLVENRLRPYQSPCIVKQLQPRSSDPEILSQAQSRFGTEVDVLRKLGHHRQIPELLDHFQVQQDFYLVQEFIDGEDLSKELAQGKPWSEAEVVALLQDVLKTLDFIHKERVIHCDIKPSNLIRRQQDGKIVLIDFGAVKEIVNSTLNPPEPRTSKPPLGTDGYMPPEQTAGRPTFCSDFYALGMTAIQALTGIPPQQLPADPQTGEIVWHENISVSPGLARILDKMVCYDFRQRYRSAGEALKPLRKLPSSKSGTSYSDTVIPRTRIPAGGRIRRWNLLAAVPFVILAIAGAIFVGNRFQRLLAVQEAIALYGEAIEEIEAPASDPTEKQKTNEKAIALLDKALKLHPDFPQALVTKGYVLGQLKRPLREKYSACNRAIELWPDFAGAYNCRGEAQKEDKDYEAALKDYDRAIELESQSNRPDYNDGTTTRRQAWYNKGEAYLKLNKCPEAIKAFQEASNLDFEPAKKKLEQVQCKDEDNN